MFTKSETHLFTARTALIAVVTFLVTLLILATAYVVFDTVLYIQDISTSY